LFSFGQKLIITLVLTKAIFVVFAIAFFAGFLFYVVPNADATRGEERREKKEKLYCEPTPTVVVTPTEVPSVTEVPTATPTPSANPTPTISITPTQQPTLTPTPQTQTAPTPSSIAPAGAPATGRG